MHTHTHAHTHKHTHTPVISSVARDQRDADRIRDRDRDRDRERDRDRDPHSFPEKKDYRPDVNIVYTDDFGRELESKEVCPWGGAGQVHDCRCNER